jgi:urea transport system ATP-binding protein
VTDEPLLEVHGARVAYGESVVVEGVGLKVMPGQSICLLGRNGAGKTTLMKAIMGTMPLRGGSITLNSQDVRRWAPYRRARAGIGYVPQGRGIFPYLSVMENLLIGLERVKDRSPAQLEIGFDLFPVLKQIANRPAGLLSGGQQQQLAIARALVSQPSLLLLDEPTEGIQPSIVEEIEEAIMSLRGKMGVLLVEQFLDFALAISDHCYVMERGYLVLEGPRSGLTQSQLQQYLSV